MLQDALRPAPLPPCSVSPIPTLPPSNQRRQGRFPPLITGVWRGGSGPKRSSRSSVGAEKMNCLPCTWLLLRPLASPISSTSPTLLRKPTYPFTLFTTLSSAHHLLGVTPVTRSPSMGGGNRATAPVLTCLDTTASLFCSQRGERKRTVEVGWRGGEGMHAG